MAIATSLVSVPGRLARWWTNNLTGARFWWSYGINRIFLGVALLWVFQSVDMDYRTFLSAQVPEHYKPIGVLYLLGRTMPDPELMNVFREVLRVSIWCVILGLFSRTSLLISVILLCALCGLQWAFSPGGWCHGWNPVLLPALAMLVGPPSPVSVDALLRRLLGRPVAWQDSWRSQCPVLLAQFAAALVFGSAALYKLYLGNHAPFAWCYSDSLRNTLLRQYWVLDQPMPAWLQFVVAHPWAYKGMAIGNVLSQLSPLLACFFFRRPLVRLLGGTAFLMEGLGIYYIMGLWNPYWLLVAAVFVDWDCLIALVRIRPLFAWLFGAPGTPDVQAVAGDPVRVAWVFSAQALWAFLFAGFYLYVAFFHVSAKRYTYPFTSFPMYSCIEASRPYTCHMPYYVYGSEWQIESDPPVPRPHYTAMWGEFWPMIWVHPDPHKMAMGIKKRLETQTGVKINAMTIHKTVFAIAPHPDTAIHPIAPALGYKYANGHAWWVKSTVAHHPEQSAPYTVRVEGFGFAAPHYRFGVYQPLGGSVQPLAGEWSDEGFCFDLSGNDLAYVVVWVRDASLGDEEALFGCQLVRPQSGP